MAWNAPGGIINFISKAGEQEGGSIGITGGLAYDALRLDAEYGGQIKATVAKDFDWGEVKIHVQHLDDEVPTYLPIPAVLTNSSLDLRGRWKRDFSKRFCHRQNPFAQYSTLIWLRRRL